MSEFLKKKKLPVPTLKNLVPPNEDYAYFEDWTKVKFRYHSTKFELINAWWLIEASLLAYNKSSFIEKQVEQLNQNASADWKFSLKFFSEENSQCFILHNQYFTIVAFRGTQVSGDFSEIVEDIYTDSKFNLVSWEDGGFVHEGFRESFYELYKKVFDYLKELQFPPTWFTGHSLGAAIATLFADQFENCKALYTFGSPRVGETHFYQDFEERTYRFVYNNDIVAQIPTHGKLIRQNSNENDSSLVKLLNNFNLEVESYQHVGHLKYFDREQQLDDHPRLGIRLMDSFLGQFKHFFRESGKLRLRALDEIPIKYATAFTDHAPIYYSIIIWNNLVDDLSLD